MSLEEFEERDQDVRQRGYATRRSVMDIGMGILWLSLGGFLLFIEKISPDMALRYGDQAYKWFGGLCVIYGLFRLYRGFKKDYFRKDS